MCAQCMATAAAAVGTAGGVRAWVAACQPAWLTPLRLKRVTAVLICAAVLAAGLGSG